MVAKTAGPRGGGTADKFMQQVLDPDEVSAQFLIKSLSSGVAGVGYYAGGVTFRKGWTLSTAASGLVYQHDRGGFYDTFKWISKIPIGVRTVVGNTDDMPGISLVVVAPAYASVFRGIRVVPGVLTATVAVGAMESVGMRLAFVTDETISRLRRYKVVSGTPAHATVEPTETGFDVVGVAPGESIITVTCRDINDLDAIKDVTVTVT